MNFGINYSCYLQFSNVTSIWNDAVADIRQKRVSMKLSKVNYISEQSIFKTHFSYFNEKKNVIVFSDFAWAFIDCPPLTTEPTSLHMSVFLTSALDMFEVTGNLFSVFRVGLIFVTLSRGQPGTAGSTGWKWSVCWHVCDPHNPPLFMLLKK